MVMILMAMKSLVLNLETLGISDEWFLVGGGGLVHFGSPWAFTIVLHAEGQWRGNLTTVRQCLKFCRK
jgi:hypothetical protein